MPALHTCAGLLGGVLLSLLATGCGVPDDPGALFVVETVDETGEPLRATRVFWYPPPIAGGSVAEHPAVCANSACTRWRWDDEPTGTFFVAAEWRGAHPAPGCQWSGYDATAVERGGAQVLTIQLRLVRLESCA